MAKQITLTEALELVDFYQCSDGTWYVNNVEGKIVGDVFGDIEGIVHGDVCGSVWGSIGGDVHDVVKGNVCSIWGNVTGNVQGTINSRKWQFVETPKDKLKRLIEEGADKEQLLEAFSQLEVD